MLNYGECVHSNAYSFNGEIYINNYRAYGALYIGAEQTK